MRFRNPAKSGLLRKLLVLPAVVATGFFSIAATPAAANSAASAADAFNVKDRVEARHEISPLGEADGAFRSLYAQWGFPSAAKGFADRIAKPEIAVPALYPLDMKQVRTSSGFGARKAPVAGASRNHEGIDLAAPLGTPIYATADGIVERSGWGNGYGKLVVIEHGNGIETRYAHMSARSVEAGDPVKKGDIIGYVGSTGRSTGPHLHYEVRVEGVAVNPASFMIEDPAAGDIRLAAR